MKEEKEGGEEIRVYERNPVLQGSTRYQEVHAGPKIHHQRWRQHGPIKCLRFLLLTLPSPLWHIWKHILLCGDIAEAFKGDKEELLVDGIGWVISL